MGIDIECRIDEGNFAKNNFRHNFRVEFLFEDSGYLLDAV